MNRGNQIERNAALLRGVLELERTITASEQARIYADIKANAVANGPMDPSAPSSTAYHYRW